MLFVLVLTLFEMVIAIPNIIYPMENVELYFNKFIKTYNIVYPNLPVRQEAFERFKANLQIANELNQLSNHAYFGITKYMDADPNVIFRTPTSLLDPFPCKILTDYNITYGEAPDSWDWRKHNVVTRVKDQGGCGSCYAFSASGNVEAQFTLQYGQLIELSQQQIIDCDRESRGCLYGWTSAAFRTLIEEGGAVTAADYPYTATNGTCRKFNDDVMKVKVIGCESYSLMSQKALKRLLYYRGPISVVVEMTPFLTYQGGIITENICQRRTLQHGVLLVGYGIEHGMPYWILKNSWGADWGENGYFRLQRGEGVNACTMMNTHMSIAIIEPRNNILKPVV